MWVVEAELHSIGVREISGRRFWRQEVEQTGNEILGGDQFEWLIP